MNSKNAYTNGKERRLLTFFDPEIKALWCYLNPRSTPTFSIELLHEIRQLQDTIAQHYFNHDEMFPKFLIWDSAYRNIFSLGVDLEYLLPLIKKSNHEKLTEYIDLCSDVLYLNYVNMELPITSISILKNRAYGMGFDALVSSDIIIASRDAKCGYPAVRNGLLDSTALSMIQHRFADKTMLTKLCQGELISFEDIQHDPYFKFLKPHESFKDAIDYYINDSVSQNRNLASENLMLSLNKNGQSLTPESMLPFKRLWIKALLEIPYSKFSKLYQVVKIQKYLHEKCYLPITRDHSPLK